MTDSSQSLATARSSWRSLGPRRFRLRAARLSSRGAKRLRRPGEKRRSTRREVRRAPGSTVRPSPRRRGRARYVGHSLEDHV